MTMKGWYCIYECSEGKWLMDNQWWSADEALHTEYLPTKWEADVLITNYGMEDKPQIILRGNDYKDIAIVDKNHKTNPHSILRFETLQRAEEYLLTNSFELYGGKYYSIRKIYF